MDNTVPSKLDKVQFSFYTSEEARALSHHQITQSLAYDENKVPLKGGLYDQAMGVSPHSNIQCQTCGWEASGCQGHTGHIELAAPIYNPFLFEIAYKMMKSKCSSCHRLRIPHNKSIHLIYKFMLLNKGRIKDSIEVDEKLSEKIVRDKSIKEFSQLRSTLIEEKRDYLNDLKIAVTMGEKLRTSTYSKLKSDLSGKVWKNVVANVCPHCKAKQPKITKEGHTKIFRHPLKEKDQRGKNLKSNKKEKIETEASLLCAWQVRDELKLMWIHDEDLLTLFFNSKIIDQMFQDVLLVPPNRFRPESQIAESDSYLHVQTVALQKIYLVNEKLIKATASRKEEDIISSWAELQNTVNIFMDSSLSTRHSDKDLAGLRQLIEKKEGLFRMKMMGKRVNYAARSVISPDPYIDTNEIGIPVVFAKKLTFPEFVREENVEFLRKLVENGPHVHPGANMIEDREGRKMVLDKFDPRQLKAIARTLLTGGPGKIVYRHLHNGDMLIVNRQPTLHKPGMMAHRARVLPQQNTIRMHYSNCNTYNADFDGDEINLHFPQSHVARSEAKNIASTDYQYTAPTSGKPLRGLIQDHVDSGVLMTSRDTLLERDEYLQLVYCATVTMNISFQIPPCIIKPRMMWSGKQVISTIIQALVQGKAQLNLDEKCKVPGKLWGPRGFEEERLIIRQGYICTGVIDKNHIGSTEFGMVHAYHELYGESMASQLLTSLGKVLTQYLQMVGFTCNMDDLFLTPATNKDRDKWIASIQQETIKYAYTLRGLVPPAPEEEEFKTHEKLLKELETYMLASPDNPRDLDNRMISLLNNSASKTQSRSLPDGLVKKFPKNCFSTMVTTGAKGSMVNHNQCSFMLGQQELEGRRVPLTIVGRSLPSFAPYDPNPRAGGFIFDRFLTGIKPQEYYFHCMAGREGLVDTAVKTSRSGYLQRCLIKGLEGLMVGYDYSVRDSDGSIVQFLYGEDCIDPTKNKYVQNFEFLNSNAEALLRKYKYDEAKEKLDLSRFNDIKNQDSSSPFATALHIYSPVTPGALPNKLYALYNQFLEDKKISRKSNPTIKRLSRTKFSSLLSLKYMRSIIEPGECVGIIASQSIGEPSTQLTLNTFHLAGHGGANVTLGIPRLREILMTASANIKTPTMTLPFLQGIKRAHKLKNKLQRINFKDLLNQIKIHEKISPNYNKRIYNVKIALEPKDTIKEELGISWQTISKKVENILSYNLDAAIAGKIRKSDAKSEIMFQEKEEILKRDEEVPEIPKQKRKGSEDEIGEDEGHLATKVKNQKQEVRTYDDDLDEEDKDNMDIETEKKKTEKKKEKKVEEDISDVEEKRWKWLKKCRASESKNCIRLTFEVPLRSNILLLNEVEKQLEITYVREVEGIGNCHVIEDKNGGVLINTEGINFREIWNYDDKINLNQIKTNDVYAMLKTYGVEAAAKTITLEINGIFSHYGIAVDKRHLNLIADYMTYNGGYRPFNRLGMGENPSPLLRMSFETTMGFLSESAATREIDTGKSPASCIVLGKPARIGTNIMDILQVLPNKS